MRTKRRNYIFEDDRLKSFKDWDFSESQSCNAQKMAEAGFFCIGREAAACFMCGKELDGWEEQDDPWMEHKKHAPQCYFVKNWKKQNDYTVHELILLLETYAKNQQEKKHLDKMMKYTEQQDKIRDEIMKK
ncbi:baculoviral IAP repeat-containing protein 5.2 [Sergentomyia squamirostris]